MSLGNFVIVAFALVALIGGLTFILAACRVSGRISEMERQASQPNDNNELSFDNGNEADNAD